MSNMKSITMDFGLDDLDQVFQVAEFLEANKEELLDKFKPEVKKYMVNAEFFPAGQFRQAYNNEFYNVVARLIKKELMNHFPEFTPEEILLFSDISFLRVISEDYLLIKSI